MTLAAAVPLSAYAEITEVGGNRFELTNQIRGFVMISCTAGCCNLNTAEIFVCMPTRRKRKEILL